MYIICLTCGGYSGDSNFKKGKKKVLERQETPASPEVMIRCREVLIIHPLISELIHPDII